MWGVPERHCVLLLLVLLATSPVPKLWEPDPEPSHAGGVGVLQVWLTVVAVRGRTVCVSGGCVCWCVCVWVGGWVGGCGCVCGCVWT